MSLKYRTISEFFATRFEGKVRKIGINAGFSCPNRDGTLGTGGCSYCNNASFTPSYTRGTIAEQLRAGMEFFAHKGKADNYLAYFQSSTNTHAPLPRLMECYSEALSVQGIKGLVIATRPDCLDNSLLNYFERNFGSKAPAGHPYLLIEIGVESTNDSTLKRINRGHGWDCSVKAIKSVSERGIDVGAHLILGLPGETDADFEAHARRLSELPISTLKLHQLQIIRGTAMAREYEKSPESFELMTPEKYAGTVRMVLKNLREDIALDRFVSQAPLGMVVAPKWGLKPDGFEKLLTSL